MPYRKFPKTDTGRLRALDTLLNNNNIYVARQRFLDWQLINKAQTMHNQLLIQSNQFMSCYKAQMRNYRRIAKPGRNMMLYSTHFLKVLTMSIERGEIKASVLKSYYNLDTNEGSKLWHDMKDIDFVRQITPQIISGEKKRIANGGRPIYNPAIGLVATHYDIYCQLYEQQQILNDKANSNLESLKALRVEVDALLKQIWDIVEEYFASEPTELRYDKCREYGIVYYYRAKEKQALTPQQQ